MSPAQAVNLMRDLTPAPSLAKPPPHSKSPLRLTGKTVSLMGSLYPHTSPERRQRQPKEMGVGEEALRSRGRTCGKGPSSQGQAQRLVGGGAGCGPSRPGN